MRQTRKRGGLGRLGLQMESLEDRRLLALSAELIADLTPSGVSSSPRSFTEWDNQLYFGYSEGFSSILSAYDGTQIRDVVQEEFPLSDIVQMFATEGALYIVGSQYDDPDDPNSLTLWKFDGQQTEEVEICQNEACGPIFAPSSLTEFDGAIYLLATASDGAIPETGKVLIRLDNGGAETVAVVPGLETTDARGMLAVYQDQLLVAADTLLELSAGSLVPVSAPGDLSYSEPRELTVLGEQLLFSARGPLGREIWSFDTTQFAAVSQIGQANGDADPRELTTVGDSLFFSAEDAQYGRELWRYAVGSGTQRISDIEVGKGGSDPAELTEFQGDLVFAATVGPSDRELYRYDHQAVGRVADLWAGPQGASPTGLTTFGNELVFAADNGQTGDEPWKYDGQQVKLIADLAPGLLGSTFSGSGALHGNLVLDWDGSPDADPRFLSYDGVGLTPLFATAPGLSEPRGRILGENDDDLILLASFTSGDVADLHLASFDGTNVTRWPDEPFPSFLISDVALLGEKLYVGSDELWSFDGQQYQLVADLLPQGASRPQDFVTWQNELFLLARNDLSPEYQVWKSDGQTVTQISAVKDALAITVYNGQIHFLAEVSQPGAAVQYAVYRYQAGQSTLLQELPPDQRFLDWQVLGDQLYVSTRFYDPATQNATESVWRLSDQSVEEFAQFPLAAPATSSASGQMTSWDHQLFVVVDDSDGYGTLWRTDGTAMTPAFDNIPGGGPRVRVGFNTLFPYQDQLLIVGDDGTHGSELWRVKLAPPGDSNGDGIFDSGDLLQVFQLGKYEDGIPGNATFAEGDWNEDGDFDSTDLVFVFQAGTYVAAATPIPSQIAAAVDWLFAEESQSRKNRSWTD